MQSKRLKILKIITIAMTCIPLLTSCSGWFKPKTMTIEYDEEVKLHDGSMIWVHITRHYFYTSELAHGGAYMPSKVEISWDTGFEGVGKKSVYFTSIQIFEKYQDNFYIVGGTANQSEEVSKHSYNCQDIGTKVLNRRCLVALDSQGNFFKSDSNIIKKFNNMNILFPEGIKNWGSYPSELEGKRLSWTQKIMLQNNQSINYQRIGKPFLIGK